MTAGPGALIETMIEGAIHQVRIEYISLSLGNPRIIGWDENGIRRVVEPGWVLRIVEEAPL
jgi:hypothetical protein